MTLRMALVVVLMLFGFTCHAGVTPAELDEFQSGRNPITESPESKQIHTILQHNLPTPGWQAAVHELAATQQISTPAAALLLEAEVRLHLQSTYAPLNDKDYPPAAVVALHRQAANMQPESEWVWRVARELLGRWGPCRIDAMTEEYFRRPGAVQSFLATNEDGGYCSNWIMFLARREPPSLLIHWRMTQQLLYGNNITTAAASGQLFRAALVSKSRELAIFAARYHWEDLSRAGLFDEMLQQADELPRDLLADILDARHAPQVMLGKESIATPQGSAALAIAVRTQWLIALAERGRIAEARQWHTRLKSVSASSRKEGSGAAPVLEDDAARQDEFVSQLLAPDSGEDPYDLFIGHGGPGLYWTEGQSSPLARKAVARFFTRRSYPQVAADTQVELCSLLRYENRPEEDLVAQLPQSTREQRERLLQQQAESFSRFYGCTLPARATPPEVTRAATEYTEKPLPELLRTSVADRQARGRERVDAATAVKLQNLGEIYVVRADLTGPRWAVISASGAVDPTGEVGSGGYWLHLSDDAGRSWDRPLYLGLQGMQPYVVMPTSKLPLLAGDMLQIEVEIQQLNRDALTFPPIFLSHSQDARDLYIQRSVAELRRDSDGDGLTDVLEEKMRIDPRSKDSDQDGLEDGLDSFPQVSMAMPPHPDAEIFRATLDAILGAKSGAPVTSIAAAPADPDAVMRNTRPASESTRVVFLRGDPAWFHGIVTPTPVLVLTQQDVDVLDARYGLHFVIDFPSVWFKRDHSRALVRWSAGWRGGSLHFIRTASGWSSQSVEDWIT